MRNLALSFALALVAVAASGQGIKHHGGGGVTDHGVLTGLTDDDHPYCLLAGCTMTAPILFSDGTAAAPARSWAGDTDHGWWRSGASSFWVTNGANYFALGAARIRLHASSSFGWTSTTATGAEDVILRREAAGILSLRDGDNAQTIYINNKWTDPSNYERLEIVWSTDIVDIRANDAGTGSPRELRLSSGTGKILNLNFVAQASSNLAAFNPQTTGTTTLGHSTSIWGELYVDKSIQGSEVKALTEGSATAVVNVAVPDGDFVEFNIRWTVFASDDTDHQLVTGTNVVSCVNKADAETCAIQAVHTDTNVTSSGTLTCAETAVAATNSVDFLLNCTSSLTQTTLDAYSRLDMLNTNTVTPQ